MFNRIFLIVLDSVGVGAALDAKKYGDEKTNTFLHATSAVNEEFPNLRKLGFFNLANNNDEDDVVSYYTKGIEISNGKDTLTGHLEMMGVITEKPFITFKKFPKELIKKIEKFSGRKVIGNCPASGTEIIKKLGKKQIKSGDLIVYTSADSVLQIAAHEEYIPLDELYKICKYTREITKKDEWKVGRIIARPYIGEIGNFTRTPNRHDYTLNPPHKTVLDILKENKYDVIALGKINDIFNGCGVTKFAKTKDNLDGIKKILKVEDMDFKGLCFANLNDYDSKYGHRRDKVGYGNALKEFDNYLPDIMNKLKNDDLLIITADHGNDPTHKGTDHTRENTPIIFYHKNILEGKRLDNLECFDHIGYTILDNFNLNNEKKDTIFEKIK